jgi:hypothetical protein
LRIVGGASPLNTSRLALTGRDRKAAITPLDILAEAGDEPDSNLAIDANG